MASGREGYKIQGERVKKFKALAALSIVGFAVWWFASAPAEELRISGPIKFPAEAMLLSNAVDRSEQFAANVKHIDNGLPNFDDIVFMDDGLTALATGTDGKIWQVKLDGFEAVPLIDVPLMPAGMHKAIGKNGAYFCASYYHGETYAEGERVGLYYYGAGDNTVTPIVLDVPDTAITSGVGLVYADDAEAPTLAAGSTGGRPLAFCNDLEISEDGERIYFSEPFSYGHASMGGGTIGEAVTLANNGRLWRHDLTSGETRLVAEGFNFIDGVLYDLHPGQSREQSVLVSQTASFKLTRFYLKGPKAGRAEIVIDGLPGMADGIDRDEQGNIWTGLIKMRSSASDWIHANPWIKPLLLRLPESMLPVTNATGVMAFSPDGATIKYFAHYDGPLTSSIASVLPGPDGLYIAAVGPGKQGLPVLPWPDGFTAHNNDNFELMETSVRDIQNAILAGDITCSAVVGAYLARIEAYDKSTGMNAITVLNPRALEKAAAIDAKIAAKEKLGPLFCAPMLVKDNFDTFDMVTSGGSIALKDDLPPDDAFMVQKIREAGAIIVAKTNMAEWAFSPRQTISSSFGITANAYALGHVPAGSSGGTASGVAANFAVAGLGSDTGNSIRGPSSHLALFGIRATFGLTSRDGVIPLVFDRDVAGPMARSVEDGALIFGVVAAYDPSDSTTDLGKEKHEADYTRYLDKDGLKGARIGVLRALAGEDGDPEILALFEKALDDMRAAGAVIIDNVEIPDFDKHRNANNFCRRFRYDMHDYLTSRGSGAPFTDVSKVLETGEYSPDAKGGLEFFSKFPLDVAPEKWETPCPDYQNHTGRQAFLSAVLLGMENASIDVMVYPSWTHPPALLERANEDYKGDNSQVVAPSTGMPAVSVPMGFSYGKFPAGLQILGRPYSEGQLIKFAYAYEQATNHRKPPEAFPALE